MEPIWPFFSFFKMDIDGRSIRTHSAPPPDVVIVDVSLSRTKRRESMANAKEKQKFGCGGCETPEKPNTSPPSPPSRFDQTRLRSVGGRWRRDVGWRRQRSLTLSRGLVAAPRPPLDLRLHVVDVDLVPVDGSLCFCELTRRSFLDSSLSVCW